jgi:hypothetical protein
VVAGVPHSYYLSKYSLPALKNPHIHLQVSGSEAAEVRNAKKLFKMFNTRAVVQCREIFTTVKTSRLDLAAYGNGNVLRIKNEMKN